GKWTLTALAGRDRMRSAPATLPVIPSTVAAESKRSTGQEVTMPKVKANNITIHYEQQGTGEPLMLIPYLSADNACYAFQVAEYATHFIKRLCRFCNATLSSGRQHES